MGMRFLAGRNYTDREPSDAKPIPEVVNQALARRLFPGLDPVGRLFGAKAEFQVIGVVSDAKYRSLREPIPPTMYHLLRPSADSFILHARTRGRPESIIRPVQEIMRGLDPELPFYEIKTLAEEVQSSLWSERLVAALASVFAALAALLAAIRNLWSALVHRGPTDARDRYSNGTGGKDLEHPQAHLGPSNRHGSKRRGARPDGVSGGSPLDTPSTLWRIGILSSNALRHRTVCDVDCRGGSGAPRRPRRPH